MFGEANAADYPMNVIDSAGREVTIDAPIEMIVVLNSDAAEAASILGSTDKIMGVTDSVEKYKAYYFSNQLDDWIVVGTWKEFNYEKIADLAKDESGRIEPGMLVISYTSKVSEVDENLSPFRNIAVVGFDFYKADTMEDEITTLGVILDREEKADAYENWFQEKKDDVVSAISGLDKFKVYVEGSSTGGLGSLGTYAEGSSLNDMIQLAGGDNVIEGLTGTPKVDWETILALNPDVIIKVPPGINQLGWSDASEMEEMVDEIKSRPGANDISAVQDNKVYVIFRDMTLGAGNVVGLTYWAKMLHPEIDLDPVSVYEEYLNIRGLDYPCEKLFVYPEI